MCEIITFSLCVAVDNPIFSSIPEKINGVTLVFKTNIDTSIIKYEHLFIKLIFC